MTIITTNCKDCPFYYNQIEFFQDCCSLAEHLDIEIPTITTFKKYGEFIKYPPNECPLIKENTTIILNTYKP